MICTLPMLLFMNRSLNVILVLFIYTMERIVDINVSLVIDSDPFGDWPGSFFVPPHPSSMSLAYY